MQACCSAESRGKLARSHGGTRCVERSSSTVAMSKTGRRWTWVRPASASARRWRMPSAVVRVNAVYVPRSAAGTVASLMEKSRTWSS